LEIDDLMPIPAAVTLTQEVVDYRVMRLGELGFSPQQAHDLCDARDSAGQLVDLHEIADALAGGCDTDTAYAIYA
jgi:hypothetical protein